MTEQEKETKIKQLKEKLVAIDKKSIRSLRAVNSEIINATDIMNLRRLEEESQRIRREIIFIAHEKTEAL